MRYLLLILLQATTMAAVARPAIQDSLLVRLSEARDTAKVDLLIEIGKNLTPANPDSARYYLHQAGKLSRQLNYLRGQYFFHLYNGETYSVQGITDSSLMHSEQGIAVARKMRDSLLIGISLLNAGIAYRERGEFEKALTYCLEGREMLEGRAAKDIQAQVLDALQTLYTYRLDYARAIPLGEQAVQMAREINNVPFLVQSLTNLGLSYRGARQFSKAYALFEEAYKKAKTIDNVQMQAVTISNLADVALQAKDYPRMREYLDQAIALFAQAGIQDGLIVSLRAKSLSWLQEGRLDQARELALEALAISKEIKSKKETGVLYRQLAVIEYAAHKYDLALDYDDKFSSFVEEMTTEISSEKTAELEKKYETVKKENTIRQLETEKKLQAADIRQKKIINYALIGGAVALALLLLLLYRSYRSRQRLQQQRIAELEAQQQLLAAEAVLRGEEQERSRLAKDLHDGLGGMLTGIKYAFATMRGSLMLNQDNQQTFERSMDMLDSSIKEMRRVAHNLMPEALARFGLNAALRDFCNELSRSVSTRIEYQSIGLDSMQLDPNRSIAIYRIAQELINNALRHSGASQIVLQLSRHENNFSITVEDDGKGFDPAALNTAQGIGWKNIRHRVEFLKGKIDLQSQPGKGTSVHIEIME